MAHDGAAMAERETKLEAKSSARRNPPAHERYVGYHLRRASLTMMAGVTAALADLNVRPVHFSVFTMIIENPGITAAEICRQLSIKRANIVPILAELASRGLFVREADPKDQRSHRLFATRAGAAAHVAWSTRVRAHEEYLLRHLAPSERKTLRSLLERLWREV